jgi:hypothetical protein
MPLKAGHKRKERKSKILATMNKAESTRSIQSQTKNKKMEAMGRAGNQESPELKAKRSTGGRDERQIRHNNGRRIETQRAPK